MNAMKINWTVQVWTGRGWREYPIYQPATSDLQACKQVRAAWGDYELCRVKATDIPGPWHKYRFKPSKSAFSERSKMYGKNPRRRKTKRRYRVRKNSKRRSRKTKSFYPFRLKPTDPWFDDVNKKKRRIKKKRSR